MIVNQNIMNKNFCGSFWFEKTINGNLIGEFSNTDSTTINTESAQKIVPDSKFDGDYISTWFDIVLCKADLKIRNTNGQKFTFDWKAVGGINYEEEGFLSSENRIIGFYRKT